MLTFLPDAMFERQVILPMRIVSQDIMSEATSRLEEQASLDTSPFPVTIVSDIEHTGPLQAPAPRHMRIQVQFPDAIDHDASDSFHERKMVNDVIFKVLKERGTTPLGNSYWSEENQAKRLDITRSAQISTDSMPAEGITKSEEPKATASQGNVAKRPTTRRTRLTLKDSIWAKGNGGF